MSLIDARVKIEGSLFDGSSQQEVDRALGTNLILGANFLQGEIQQNTPVGATAALRKAWFNQYNASTKEATVFNQLSYVFPVELGRKPAFVPIKPLVLWAKRKLGLNQKEATSAAFAISRKKSRRRTPGKEFVQTTFDENVSTLQREFLEPIGAKIVEVLGQ